MATTFTRSPIDGKKATLWFGLIFALSMIMKLSRLGSRELWLDEAYSALIAHLPFKQACQFVLHDVHPPLYYALLWVWVRLFGESEVVLRLFSVCLSGIALIAIFLVIRKWLGPRAALFGSLLFALSPMLYTYSLEVRMYMLAVCFVIAIMGVHRSVTSEAGATAKQILLYSVLCAALYYTHYIGLFLLVGLFLDWIIATKLQWIRLRLLLLAGVCIIVLISPWLPVMFHQQTQKKHETKVAIASVADPNALTYGVHPDTLALVPNLKAYMLPIGAAIGMPPIGSNALSVFLGIPVLLLLGGVLFFGLKGDAVCRLCVIVAATVFLGAFILGSHSARFFLPVTPFMFLAMARVVQLGSLSRWRLAATVLAVLALVPYAAGTIRQATLKRTRPFTMIVATLQKNYQPKDVVVFDALYVQVMFDYYARQANFHPNETGFPESVYDWWQRQPFKGWGGPIITKSDLDTQVDALTKTAQTGTVWLVLFENNYYDPKDDLLKRMSHAGEATRYPVEQDGDQDSRRLFAVRAK